MTDSMGRHPDLNELLIGVVDEQELAAEVRAHLQQCASCRAEKERFEADLDRFAAVAAERVPRPNRAIVLPELESTSFFRPLSVWKMAFGGICGAIVVLGLLLGSIGRKAPSPPDLPALLAEMQEDERLMGEIAALEQDLLPRLCRDLTDEPDAGFDENFMEYVVPVPGDEELSGEDRKGGTTC